MQINITVDCTAEEAREMLGLPNVQKIQDQWLQKVGENILENTENFTPDKILSSWVSGASSNIDKLSGALSAFIPGDDKK